DAANGFKTLSRVTDDTSETVTVTTKLGQGQSYRTERLTTGDIRRTFTDPSGLTASVRINTDGTRIRMSPDGQSSSATRGPDSRFGMVSPIIALADITMPSGLTSHLTSTTQSALSDTNNLLSLTSRVDTASINGRAFTSTYTASPRRVVTNSAA